MSTSIHSRRGQTLVEALVALSILTIGFIGIVTLLTKSFQLNRTIANDTQATYLAAEGIELTKNFIDYDVYSAFSSGGSSSNGFGDCFRGNPGYLSADYSTTNCSANFSPSAPVGHDQLYFDPVTHLYSLTSLGGPPSIFTREIHVIPNYDPITLTLIEIDVQSIVTWADGGLSNSVTLEDHFYNWHP
jgi:hypothetical protein